MSDRPLARAVLLTHGDMAAGVVDAVEQITGAGRAALVPISNRSLSPETLVAELRRLLGEGPALLFTDMQTGSCGFAGRRLTQQLPELVVISGVNLPLLLEFVLHRDLPLEELVPRLLDKGRAAVSCVPTRFEQDADRTVSRR